MTDTFSMLVPTEAAGMQVFDGGDMPVAVPSGQDVRLQEVLLDPVGPTLRFRFVAPAIAVSGGEVPFEVAEADIADLCQSFALPWISEHNNPPAQIVISLSDRPVPFGQSIPDATQYFEAFSLADGACILEIF